MKNCARFAIAIAAVCAGVVPSTASANPPVVSIDNTPTALFTTAHVSGKVNPEDQETYYYFQYSTDPANEGWAYGPGAYSEALQPNSGEKVVSDELSGLKPGMEYEIRLVAENFVDPPQTSAEPNPTFTTQSVGAPDISIHPVTTVGGTTATLTGEIDPEATSTDPAFDVNWHFECDPECPGLKGGMISADDGGAPNSSSQLVQASAVDLEPNTSYEVRLVAENAAGPVSAGPETFSTDPVAPAVQTLFAGVTYPEAAVLAGRVNPRNSDASFQFRWGPTAAVENVSPATPQPIGAADSAFHFVASALTGLESGETYFFRIVATNEETLQTNLGPIHTFTTAESTEPPVPQRHFELVSVGSTNSYDVKPRFGARSSTANGDRIVFNLGGAAPDSASGGGGTMVASRDPASGWDPIPIDPPSANGKVPNFDAFTEDLSQGYLNAYVPLVDGALGGGQTNLYRASTFSAIGPYELLSPGAGGGPINPFTKSTFAGASADGSHVVFETTRFLTPESPTTSELGYPVNSYEWTSGGISLVGVLPNENPVPDGASIGSGIAGSTERAISDDGSRIVFHALDFAWGGRARGQIYVREDGVRSIHVTRSQRTDCASAPDTCTGVSEPDPSGPQDALFWSAEGSSGDLVLFSSCERLTDDSTARAASSPGDRSCTNDARSDLYLFDVDSEQLTDLTTTDSSGADVLGVVATDDALGIVYFVARGALADGAEEGKPNLYRWTDDEISLIATLDDSALDSASWSPNPEQHRLNVRASADLRYLLITTRARISAYDNSSPSCPSERCSQVYLFDASRDAMRCVSCPVDGSPASGDASLAGSALTSEEPPARNLTANGERVFFETSEPLVAGDTNGKRDAYEWNDGALSLLSTGGGGFSSRFVEASSSGEQAFISTRERLVGEDRDALVDLYAIRPGVGLEDGTSAAPLPCDGDACQGAPRIPEAFPAPGSVHSSPGTAPARSCRKKKPQKSRRCIRRQHKVHKHPKQMAGGNR